MAHKKLSTGVARATQPPVEQTFLSVHLPLKSAKLIPIVLLAVALYTGGCSNPTKTDTNPPATPTNLTATAKSSVTIELTWQNQSSDEQGFNIERSTGEQWAVAGQVGVDIETFLDTGLSPETSYIYRVNAYNGDGVSSYSNESTATTLPAGPASDWEFASIPAGSFDMGSPDDEVGRYGDEDPVHRVTFANGFKMLATEVTQRKWKEIMGADNNPSFSRGDSLPVEQVGWDDTQRFLTILNQQDPGEDYRLPSEAEWEYACRAGTTTRFYWGDDPDYSQIGTYAWFFGNFTNRTSPVGTKTPNAWGLYDMIGNVWEWCDDDAHADYTGAPTDGSSWAETPHDTTHTWRGGSIRSYDIVCRSANRGGYGAGVGTGWRGFRVVRRD